MKIEEEIAFKAALEKLKKLELENEKLKSENSKISNDLIDAKALYESSSKSLKNKEKENNKLKKALTKKETIIAKKEAIIAEKDDLISKKDNIISEQAKNLKDFKKYLVDNKIMTQKAINDIFGKSSAKTKNLIYESISNNTDLPIKKDKETEKRGRKPGDQNFHDWNENNYESIDVECDLPKEEKVCPDCGKDLTFLRREKVEKIAPVKACVRKTIYWIYVYKCNNCGKIVKSRCKYEDCFKSSACTPELAGYISLLSAGLFLPSKRISDLFNYNGTPISRELITRYLIKTGELLSEFVGFLRKRMQKSDVLMFDETTWNVLKDDENQVNRIWGMTTGPKEKHQAVYFLYSSTRKYENFDGMLDDDYDGTIVSDAYGAYFHHALHQLCWSHLRKYLFDYLNAVKCPESEDYRQIKTLLDKANLVFLKERELSKLPEEELKKRRTSELKPLIDDYFKTAEYYYDEKIQDPKNKAINYGLKHKENYYTLIENPKAPATNNISEQSMRKVVMKRVTSMFSTSKEGADSMCVILSLVQSARLNNISPDKYIVTLLKNLVDLKDERIAASYLPWSTELKKKIGFTKEEIEQAKQIVEKETKKK